jgi:hypothetical protein
MTTEDQITIELILEEARAWGLGYEVEATAKEIMKDGVDELTAYQDAYYEWIK